MENENKAKLIAEFAKKGFLLDKDSLDFFIQLEDMFLAEDILNKIVAITKVRIIHKKTIVQNYLSIKEMFSRVLEEKKFLVQEFFSGADLFPKTKDSKPIVCEPQKCCNEVKILSSEILPYKRIEVKDFVIHFKNRYNFFKELLKDRKELDNLISIDKIGNNRTFSIIGLVSSKRITKNKNLLLEVEDLSGRINVLVSQDKESLLKKSKEIILDDIVGLKCSSGVGRDFYYANEIVFAESYVSEKIKTEEESYALFISDIHVGSKFFLEENFLKFLKWINCEGVSSEIEEKVRKIKYLFIVGDNIDGVGVYPGQEALLTIKDIKEQNKKLAEYLDMIPKRIKIIMCPGQHDSVRVPEPQPAIDEEFGSELMNLQNLSLVCNPALVEINCGEKKKGIKVLMYHGASMLRGWIDEIEDLRVGQAHLYPSKVVKYMLRHRHLSPSHSANVYVPSEKEDPMIIKEVPDIITTGDLHKADIDTYNNVLIISCSCWQTTTPFEEKVGNHPDPCKVPMLNLKTREIKILDFN